jgi:uncharacterized protein (DUF2252 family)
VGLPDTSKCPSKARAKNPKAARKAAGGAGVSILDDSAWTVSAFTETTRGRLQLKSNPPVLGPLRALTESACAPDVDGMRDDDVLRLVKQVLAEYRMTLSPDSRRLADQYSGADVARLMAGIGPVDLRAWAVALQGASEDDVLVLQVKEAAESVLERFAGKSRYREPGRRVVEGQRAMQASGDILLGWCRVPDARTGVARHYYVRQLWNRRGVSLASASPHTLEVLAMACG